MFTKYLATIVAQQSFNLENTRTFGLSSCVVTTTMKTFYIINIDVKKYQLFNRLTTSHC